MPCKTESKQIGDHEYSVTQWPVEKSLLMKMRLIKTFGASLAKLASSLETDEKKKSENNQIDSLSDGLNLLFQSNSPEEIVALMKSCVVGVAVDGKRITDSSFNEVFDSDSMMEIYQVFLFVIQVNYGNFIKGQWADSFLAKMKESL